MLKVSSPLSLYTGKQFSQALSPVINVFTWSMASLDATFEMVLGLNLQQLILVHQFTTWVHLC